MKFKTLATSAGLALALAAAASTAQAITVNMGPSAQNFTLYGLGPDAQGHATYRIGQGSSTFDGVTSTFTLSGAITGSDTAAFSSGTYDFITTYAGADAPMAGPNAPGGIELTLGSNQFSYNFLAPSVRMVLLLHTAGGDFSQTLFQNGQFLGGFSFAYAAGTGCTGVAVCTQSNVGLTPGATISGPVTIGASFSSAIVTPVPEPATWAMMLAGFGGLGALLRRRRGLAAA